MNADNRPRREPTLQEVFERIEELSKAGKSDLIDEVGGLGDSKEEGSAGKRGKSTKGQKKKTMDDDDGGGGDAVLDQLFSRKYDPKPAMTYDYGSNTDEAPPLAESQTGSSRASDKPRHFISISGIREGWANSMQGLSDAAQSTMEIPWVRQMAEAIQAKMDEYFVYGTKSVINDTTLYVQVRWSPFDKRRQVTLRPGETSPPKVVYKTDILNYFPHLIDYAQTLYAGNKGKHRACVTYVPHTEDRELLEIMEQNPDVVCSKYEFLRVNEHRDLYISQWIPPGKWTVAKDETETTKNKGKGKGKGRLLEKSSDGIQVDCIFPGLFAMACFVLALMSLKKFRILQKPRQRVTYML